MLSYFFKLSVKIRGVRRIEKIGGEANEMTDIQVMSYITFPQDFP